MGVDLHGNWFWWLLLLCEGEKSEAREPPPPSIEGPLQSFHSKVDWRLSLSSAPSGEPPYPPIQTRLTPLHKQSCHPTDARFRHAVCPVAAPGGDDRRFRGAGELDARRDAASMHRPRRKVRARPLSESNKDLASLLEANHVSTTLPT